MNIAHPLPILVGALLLAPITDAFAVEYHVAKTGHNSNSGTAAAPFQTIQRAADAAQPGDAITVRAGVYRERINPPRGGESDSRRIVYQAAPGERVEIRGSEVVKNWIKVQDDVWKSVLPNWVFGAFNPFADLIQGDWFDPRGREHHTGAVYLDGEWLTEAAKYEDVLMPVANTPLWFARVDDHNTTVWAQFKGVNPNERQVEVNVRQTVFYPDKPGRNYLTVRGFVMRHAATPWAPPTAEQIGLIGTHWSKGWIIENNVISHSACSGIALGKHGDEFDNTSANTAEGYVKTIERGLARGWNRETIGHHTIRNNWISHCEQTGVVGSLGGAFSTITGNVIHDIHVRGLFSGAEMAGIKLHAAIDTTIQRNHIYRTCRGLWLDWMAQGTRVSGNFFHENAGEDLFVEVNHGPFMIDNNLFLSPTSLLDMSEGGAYVHNLFAGRIINRPEPNRETPYHPAHTTTMAGLATTKGGDNRFYNNIMVGNGQPPAGNAAGYGLWVYDDRPFPMLTGGNVYYYGAKPYSKEEAATQVSANPQPKLLRQESQFVLQFNPGSELKDAHRQLVTTALLGRAKVPDVAYENADGSPMVIRTDYFGKSRNESNPTAGPFENPEPGPVPVHLWPADAR